MSAPLSPSLLTVAVALGLASAVLLLVLQDNLEKSTRAEAAEKANVAAAVRVAKSLPPPAGMPGVAGDVKVSTSFGGPAWKTGSGYVVACGPYSRSTLRSRRAAREPKFSGVRQRKIITLRAVSPFMRGVRIYVGFQVYTPGRGVTADAVPHFSSVGPAGAAAGL